MNVPNWAVANVTEGPARATVLKVTQTEPSRGFVAWQALVDGICDRFNSSISLPLHCLHTWDSSKNVGRFLSLFMVLENIWSVSFFFEKIFSFFEIFYDLCGISQYEACFLDVVRHPADSDGRPTAGAQVLAWVSMVPWHPCHSGPALHSRVPSRSESCYSPTRSSNELAVALQPILAARGRCKDAEGTEGKAHSTVIESDRVRESTQSH